MFISVRPLTDYFGKYHPPPPPENIEVDPPPPEMN